MDGPEGDCVLLGKVARAHGIRGEVAIYPFSGEPANFREYRELILSDGRVGGGKSYAVTGCRCKGRLAIVGLAGIGDRTSAETLRGREVWVSSSALPPLEPDEFYWHETVGMAVYTTEGRRVGRVVSIFRTAAHDVLVVGGDGREYLVPARREFVVSLDPERRELVLDAPEGLLE